MLVYTARRVEAGEEGYKPSSHIEPPLLVSAGGVAVAPTAHAV